MRDFLLRHGKTAIMIFGGVLFVVVLTVFIWSLFQPPVLDGPWPPTRLAPDAGLG